MKSGSGIEGYKDYVVVQLTRSICTYTTTYVVATGRRYEMMSRITQGKSLKTPRGNRIFAFLGLRLVYFS